VVCASAGVTDPVNDSENRMTIELYFSNQLDQLADKFSDTIAAENRSKTNIFDAPVVIVPNANLAKWLQLFLAKKIPSL